MIMIIIMIIIIIYSVEMISLSDGCVPELCAAVRASASLKTLVLNNNQLTDGSIPALVRLAQHSRNMEELK